MARVFITGSSDGLGLLAARVLNEQGHEEVALRVYEDPSNALQVVDRVQELSLAAVDHFDAIGSRVSDVHSPSAISQPNVGVVEAGLPARWERDEAGPAKAHAAAPPLLTSFLHQA